MPPVLSKQTPPNAPGSSTGAGSKRGPGAVPLERNSGKKPHEVSRTPKKFSLISRLLCQPLLNARLQCDLGCPAVLAARIYTTYAPCEPQHVEVGTMNRPSNDNTITRPVAYSELTTTCACAPQDVETAPRAILLFKQMDYDGKGRLPLTDAEVLTALGAHCDRANISTNKPQYGFFSDSKTGPWKAFFDDVK